MHLYTSSHLFKLGKEEPAEYRVLAEDNESLKLFVNAQLEGDWNEISSLTMRTFFFVINKWATVPGILLPAQHGYCSFRCCYLSCNKQPTFLAVFENLCLELDQQAKKISGEYKMALCVCIRLRAMTHTLKCIHRWRAAAQFVAF